VSETSRNDLKLAALMRMQLNILFVDFPMQSFKTCITHNQLLFSPNHSLKGIALMVEWDKADCVLSAFFKEKQTYSNIAS
jgi:hypothetical protein